MNAHCLSNDSAVALIFANKPDKVDISNEIIFLKYNESLDEFINISARPDVACYLLYALLYYDGPRYHRVSFCIWWRQEIAALCFMIIFF
jgi:hypothetical protein